MIRAVIPLTGPQLWLRKPPRDKLKKQNVLKQKPRAPRKRSTTTKGFCRVCPDKVFRRESGGAHPGPNFRVHRPGPPSRSVAAAITAESSRSVLHRRGGQSLPTRSLLLSRVGSLREARRASLVRARRGTLSGLPTHLLTWEGGPGTRNQGVLGSVPRRPSPHPSSLARHVFVHSSRLAWAPAERLPGLPLRARVAQYAAPWRQAPRC